MLRVKIRSYGGIGWDALNVEVVPDGRADWNRLRFRRSRRVLAARVLNQAMGLKIDEIFDGNEVVFYTELPERLLHLLRAIEVMPPAKLSLLERLDTSEKIKEHLELGRLIGG